MLNRPAGFREGLAWLRARLLDDDRLVAPATVRVYVTGERAGSRWRLLPSWPPPGIGEWRLWVAADGRLQEREPTEALAGPDRYRYDPVDPTPSVGGPVLLAREPVVDNRALEARADVLTYTTEPLSSALQAVGPVRVELWMRAGSPYFRRVCPGLRRRRGRSLLEHLRRAGEGRARPL